MSLIDIMLHYFHAVLRIERCVRAEVAVPIRGPCRVLLWTFQQLEWTGPSASRHEERVPRQQMCTSAASLRARFANSSTGASIAVWGAALFFPSGRPPRREAAGALSMKWRKNSGIFAIKAAIIANASHLFVQTHNRLWPVQPGSHQEPERPTPRKPKIKGTTTRVAKFPELLDFAVSRWPRCRSRSD